MIPHDPSRLPPATSFRPSMGPVERAPEAQAPAFPRSGWSDQNSLSTSLREAILKMRFDFSDYFNWRRPPAPPQASDPPQFMPMYGMPNPGGGGGGGGGIPIDPRPPEFMPMYGMPNPGGGGGGTLPTDPKPPNVMPMYGMPNPGGGGGGTFPTEPKQPDVMPMYGMPNPRG